GTGGGNFIVKGVSHEETDLSTIQSCREFQAILQSHNQFLIWASTIIAAVGGTVYHKPMQSGNILQNRDFFIRQAHTLDEYWLKRQHAHIVGKMHQSIGCLHRKKPNIISFTKYELSHFEYFFLLLLDFK
ncbi:hypothetical protein ACJX0J_041186, partial [Zea mays]